jgi:hypothetical protein
MIRAKRVKTKDRRNERKNGKANQDCRKGEEGLVSSESESQTVAATALSIANRR